MHTSAATDWSARNLKLYTNKGAANPRRVVMFLAEKGVRDIPTVEVNLLAGEHESPE